MRELLCLAVGKLENLIDLGNYVKYKVAYDGNSREGDNTGDSVLVELKLEPDSKEMEFLVRLASGDPRVWAMQTNEGQLFSMRIHSNTKVI